MLMISSTSRIIGGTSRSICDFGHEGRRLYVKWTGIHDVFRIGRWGLSFEDVDCCGLFFQYVCKDISDIAVFSDLFGRATQLIVVVD
jgi:hypothetical protein